MSATPSTNVTGIAHLLMRADLGGSIYSNSTAMSVSPLPSLGNLKHCYKYILPVVLQSLLLPDYYECNPISPSTFCSSLIQ